MGSDKLKYDYALLKLKQKVSLPSYVELGADYAKEDEPLGIVGYRGPACNIHTAPQISLWKAKGHSVEDFSLKHNLSTC